MPDNQTVLHSQIFDQKNHFHFLVLKLNNFLLKHKISEQQVNPKALSVATSCHYNGNSKNGKSRLDKCPPLGSYPNKSPLPGQKLGCKSPRGWEYIFGEIPGGARGEMVMDETDTYIKIRSVKIAQNVRGGLPIASFSYEIQSLESSNRISLFDVTNGLHVSFLGTPQRVPRRTRRWRRSLLVNCQKTLNW